MFDNISIPIVIGAAVIDSINPCAFGVLIFLLAYLFKNANTRKKMLSHAFVYIAAVFLTYLIAGLILLPTIQALGNFSTTAYIVIGVIIIIAGLLELKDVFWYGKGLSLSIAPSSAKRIQMYVKRISGNYLTSFSLGVFVALVELPCTGAVYLGVLALMSVSGVNINNIVLLLLYNVLFVAPLFLITWLVSRGLSADKFEVWRKKHRKLMRLGAGLILLLMGVWMILFVVM